MPETSHSAGRLPRYLLLVMLIALLGGGAGLPASGLGATINPITFSADPTQSKPVTVSVSGTLEVARSLWVYRRAGTAVCAPTAYAESASSADSLGDSYGESLPAGAFSEVYTFTPTVTGQHRICAYVGATDTGTPLATQTATVDVRSPNAAVSSITFSADPTQSKPVTVSVSGTLEVARSLWVYRRAGTAACAPTAYAESASSADSLGDSYGESLPAGAFSEVYTFTPTVTGAHRVCAYLGAGGSVAPLATGSDLVDVRALRASLAVDGIAPYLSGQTSHVRECQAAMRSVRCAQAISSL